MVAKPLFSELRLLLVKFCNRLLKIDVYLTASFSTAAGVNPAEESPGNVGQPAT